MFLRCQKVNFCFSIYPKSNVKGKHYSYNSPNVVYSSIRVKATIREICFLNKRSSRSPRLAGSVTALMRLFMGLVQWNNRNFNEIWSKTNTLPTFGRTEVLRLHIVIWRFSNLDLAENSPWQSKLPVVKVDINRDWKLSTIMVNSG